MNCILNTISYWETDCARGACEEDAVWLETPVGNEHVDPVTRTGVGDVFGVGPDGGDWLGEGGCGEIYDWGGLMSAEMRSGGYWCLGSEPGAGQD